MVDHAATREYWLEHYDRHADILARHAIESEVSLYGADPDAAADRAAAFAADLRSFLRSIAAEPAAFPDLSISLLCQRRQELLAEHGFRDAFRSVKDRENAAALQILPSVLERLDQLPPRERALAIIEGILVGNLFDLGSIETAEMYEAGQMQFEESRAKLPPRPWLVDDADPFVERLRKGGYQKAVVLVDNSGSDVVLGMIPLARFLATIGTTVLLAANERPALNDITSEELRSVLRTAAALDATLEEAIDHGRLEVISTGTGSPVINLKNVDSKFADTSRDADLLVLEGMGRALETNYDTRMTVDTLKIATIKDRNVADHFAAKLFDVVCRFETA